LSRYSFEDVDAVRESQRIEFGIEVDWLFFPAGKTMVVVVIENHIRLPIHEEHGPS
jgi:hypothetical protein